MEETIWQTPARHCSNSIYFAAISVLLFISWYRDSCGNWDSLSFCIKKKSNLNRTNYITGMFNSWYTVNRFSHIEQAKAETQNKSNIRSQNLRLLNREVQIADRDGKNKYTPNGQTRTLISRKMCLLDNRVNLSWLFTHNTNNYGHKLF